MSTTANDDIILLRIEERDGVRSGDAGRVAWVTFNNPEKRNSIDVAAKKRFIEVMTDLKHDDTLRAVVITGAGEKSFVGGTNLAEMAQFSPAQAEAAGTLTHRVCDSVRQMPVPVIARINGYCFGSGMEIAACADMRVGVEGSKLGMPEVRFGIPSAMEASALPRLMGWGKACELVLTGDHITAEEAHRIGYLERLVAPDELDNAVESWLESIMSCGANAIRIQKRLLLQWDSMSVTDGAREGIRAFADAFRVDEPNRMMMAFVNRKK